MNRSQFYFFNANRCVISRFMPSIRAAWFTSARAFSHRSLYRILPNYVERTQNRLKYSTKEQESVQRKYNFNWKIWFSMEANNKCMFECCSCIAHRIGYSINTRPSLYFKRDNGVITRTQRKCVFPHCYYEVFDCPLIVPTTVVPFRSPSAEYDGK